MKRVLWTTGGLLLGAFYGFVLMSCAPGGAQQAQPIQRISIATGGTAGLYYITGAGVAAVVSKYVPNVQMTVEVTAASTENVRLLSAKKVAVALMTSDTAHYAYNGGREFKDTKYPDLRGMTASFTSWAQIIVPAGSPIKTIADMKGKRVSVGAPGSGNEVIANAVMTPLGVTRQDFKPEMLTYAETVTAWKDGSIDAAFIWSSIPHTGIMDILTGRAIRFIPTTESEAKTVVAKNPFFYPLPIPARSYKGQEQDIPTLAGSSILTTHKDTDEQLVYSITKAVLEHTDEMAAIHPAGKEYNIQNTVRQGVMTLPWHPGAERYLKEKGALK